MKYIKLFSVLLICIWLGACTMLYKREFIVEPTVKISVEETEAVFVAFRNFLSQKGFEQISYNGEPSSTSAAFRIAGSESGAAIRLDWGDILELTYTGGNNFRLNLTRISHSPSDFSELYLQRFVTHTQNFIKEATSKEVKLNLVPNEST